MNEERALLAAREIVKHLCGLDLLDGSSVLEFPFNTYNESTGETSIWEYDGLVLLIESIIAHQYSEEPRDESIPFS